MNSSGKLVIIGILGVALASAVVSWWFRYSATHRVVGFWGPAAARLIRDAPHVELYELVPPIGSTAVADANEDDLFNSAHGRDISTAPGLMHLRNALLEDRSFEWPPAATGLVVQWQWAMNFSDAALSEQVVLLFSADWKRTATLTEPGKVLSCSPIAEGLQTMLGEIATGASPPPR